MKLCHTQPMPGDTFACPHTGAEMIAREVPAKTCNGCEYADMLPCVQAPACCKAPTVWPRDPRMFRTDGLFLIFVRKETDEPINDDRTESIDDPV